MTEASGTTVGEDRFCEAPLWGYPYGETRFTTGTMYTDKLFTGQREETGLGIYHYGARFYSPKLGRFLSPDTLVPGYGNPQAWNHYSYVLGNPLKFTDPTGHMQASDDPKCNGCTMPLPICSSSICNPNYPPSGGGGNGGSGQGDDEPVSSTPTPSSTPQPTNVPTLDTPDLCDITTSRDCQLSAASLIATVVAAVPGPIGWVGFAVDVVATVIAIGRTNDDYHQGEISRTRQYALNITGIVGVLPGGLLGEWAFPVSFVAGLANLLMTASGLPN